MTIGDLLAALRRFRMLALGLAVGIVAIGVGAVAVQPSRYESDAVVTITPEGEGFSFEAQQAVEFLTPPIITRLESAAFEQAVRDRLRPQFRGATLDISAANDPGTPVIDVSVQSDSPAAAENGAQVAASRIMQEPRSEQITIQLVSPATGATSVKAERAPRILMGSLLLGIIAAVLAAAIAHRLRPTLPRSERFRERYGYEVLGEIPRGRSPEAAATTANGAGDPELAEAFRSLEARFTMRLVARGARDMNVSIAVTSWGDHDGKSTVATHLAWALAGRDRKVTLVDCDMRRPSVHELVGAPLEPGVADIAERKAVRSACHETPLRTLEVIPAGKPRRHPAEVLHDALPRVLSALKDRTIIIDTPPMFTAEATAIAGQSDFVVLVADYVKRTAAELDDALAELELGETPVLGVVLNRVTERDTRGRESYAYQVEAESKRPAPRA